PMPGISMFFTLLAIKKSRVNTADLAGSCPHISCLSLNASSQNSVIASCRASVLIVLRPQKVHRCPYQLFKWFLVYIGQFFDINTGLPHFEFPQFFEQIILSGT